MRVKTNCAKTNSFYKSLLKILPRLNEWFELLCERSEVIAVILVQNATTKTTKMASTLTVVPVKRKRRNAATTYGSPRASGRAEEAKDADARTSERETKTRTRTQPTRESDARADDRGGRESEGDDNKPNSVIPHKVGGDVGCCASGRTMKVMTTTESGAAAELRHPS
mmetsp:Transcript_40318/g.74623  ORF Transcript_40318/g.74623 Transcript_40318/m.74623 type:complete len:168 (-) Transcript_40318:149-652(-)